MDQFTATLDSEEYDYLPLQASCLVPGTSSLFTSLRLTSIRRFRSGRQYETALFRAKLLFEGSSDPVDVVLKTANRGVALEDLEQEANWYADARMKPFQGKLLAQFYGLFVGTDRKYNKATKILVASYCGEKVKQLFCFLPWDFRLAVMNASVALHRAGIKHDFVAEHNVTNNDGKPVLMDLSYISLHDCPCKDIDFYPGAFRPDKQDYPCHELYLLGEALNIWRDTIILFIGVSVGVDKFETVPELMDCCKDALGSIDREYLLAEAETIVEEELRKDKETPRWAEDGLCLVHIFPPGRDLDAPYELESLGLTDEAYASDDDSEPYASDKSGADRIMTEF